MLALLAATKQSSSAAAQGTEFRLIVDFWVFVAAAG
jgi:hypothetical protein